MVGAAELAGSELPSHKVSESIMLHSIEGRVQLGLSDAAPELGPED